MRQMQVTIARRKKKAKKKVGTGLARIEVRDVCAKSTRGMINDMKKLWGNGGVTVENRI